VHLLLLRVVLLDRVEFDRLFEVVHHLVFLLLLELHHGRLLQMGLLERLVLDVHAFVVALLGPVLPQNDEGVAHAVEGVLHDEHFLVFGLLLHVLVLLKSHEALQGFRVSRLQF
jgi:hypothetical protein